MHIPLSEFEQRIDDTILSRGLVYFKKGAVKACSRIAPGEYTATVEGSNSYTVHFTSCAGYATLSFFFKTVPWVFNQSNSPDSL